MHFGEPRNSVEKEIRDLETQIVEMKAKVRDLLAKVPDEEVADYKFKDVEGKTVGWDTLFGDKDELILIHNMGPGCSYCTLWADGFEGFIPYFKSRCAFVLETDIPADHLSALSDARLWPFDVYSTIGTTLKKDMGFKVERDGQWMNVPGFSTFFKKNGKVFRHTSGAFGPGDDFCAIWPFLDRLKKGQNNWGPTV